MSDELEQKIRYRAYELWEQGGKPPGEHLRYWLAAEKELTEGQLEKELESSFPASDPPSSTMRS